MMKQIKGAIFDFDGTLLDSMWMWVTVGQQYLQSIGVAPKSDVDQETVCMSLLESAAYIKRDYCLTQTIDEICEGVNRIAQKGYFETLPLKPGVQALLDRFHKSGVRMCVATASEHYLVEAAMRRTGILPLFDGIFTCTELGTTKRSPYIYEVAMKHLGTAKEDTIVFEDAAHAVETAKAAGFLVAGVYDPTEQGNMDVIHRRADWYFHSLEEWPSVTPGLLRAPQQLCTASV